MEDLRENLLNFLSLNNNAFIKYQQRDEEELSSNQRKTIAENLLNKSCTMFLNRFGHFILKEHLNYFNKLLFDDKDKEEMIKKQVSHLLWNLENQLQVTRNRRYACMLKMIKENNDYFSEDTMIKRDPELYEEIVGQFLTAAEKQARKNFDVKNCSLVEILFESIDKQNEEEKRLASNLQENQSDDSNSQPASEMQWGNFDNESNKRERKRKCKYISKGEQSILKDEWIGIMYNNFLSGKDKEFFDYTEVDNNEMYDETTENDQDCQDKYFDDEDEESIQSAKISNKADEEDELDIYMQHLEKHIQRQNQDNFQEEFDDE